MQYCIQQQVLLTSRCRTIKENSKPLTAKCDKKHYTLFLISKTKHAECKSRLAEILGNISYEDMNRFLLREQDKPEDLFEMVKVIINLMGVEYEGDSETSGVKASEALYLGHPQIYEHDLEKPNSKKSEIFKVK